MRNKLEIKMVGFAPDLDPRTPGVIRECERLVPTYAGFKPMRKPEDVGLAALAAECRGGAVLISLDGSKRLVAGTQTALYQAGTTTWSDISRVGGYSGGSENRWRFAQFGDATVAVNRSDEMQYSTGTTFADMGGGSPKASIVETCGPGFVMAFDYDDGVNEYQDGWWCSALSDPTDWTPAIASQSANGRLTQTPGSIRAGKKLGQDIIAYKERSMYIGRYVGPPIIWDWQLIPGDIGAPSQESVVDIGTAHIFPGYEDFYYFDGSRPVSIGNPLRDWYNTNVSGTYKYRMKSLHDRAAANVYFFFADSDGVIMEAPVYNYRADKWGFASLYTGKSLEHVVEYISGGITYDGLGDLYSTYEDLPSIPYNSPFWTNNSTAPAFFQNDHKLYSLTGSPTAQSSFLLNYNGSDDGYSTLTRIRPKYITASTGEININTLEYVGASETVNGPYTLDKKSDMLLSSKWFAPEFIFESDYELNGYTGYYEEDGLD